MAETPDWTPPERIYLQPSQWPEVTWCDHPVEDDDVEYVRAARLREEERRVERVTSARDFLLRDQEPLEERRTKAERKAEIARAAAAMAARSMGLSRATSSALVPGSWQHALANIAAGRWEEAAAILDSTEHTP